LEELVAGEDIPAPQTVVDLSLTQGKTLYERLNKEQKRYFHYRMIGESLIAFSLIRSFSESCTCVSSSFFFAAQ